MAPDSTVGVTSVTFMFCYDTLKVVLDIPPLNLHPMQTKNKSGIIKKKTFLSALQDFGGIDLSVVEPSTYKSTIKVYIALKLLLTNFLDTLFLLSKSLRYDH